MNAKKERQALYEQVSESASRDTLDHLDEPDNGLGRRDHLSSTTQRHRRKLLYGAVFGSIALAGIIGFVLGSCLAPKVQASSHTSPHSTPSPANSNIIKGCGDSLEEAKSMGCKFDLMLQRWIPADCYDEAHSEHFLAKYPRKWYYDSNLKHEMDDVTVRKGEHRATFTPSDYHKRHCTYTWELTSRALQEQRPLLDELISFEHTHHCNGILMGPEWNVTRDDGRLRPTEVDPGYLRCAPYSVWLQDMPE